MSAATGLPSSAPILGYAGSVRGTTRRGLATIRPFLAKRASQPTRLQSFTDGMPRVYRRRVLDRVEGLVPSFVRCGSGCSGRWNRILGVHELDAQAEESRSQVPRHRYECVTMKMRNFLKFSDLLLFTLQERAVLSRSLMRCLTNKHDTKIENLAHAGCQ